MPNEPIVNVQYKDLQELSIKDWDGKPFQCYATDFPAKDCSGLVFTCCGFCDGKWVTQRRGMRGSCSHVYPLTSSCVTRAEFEEACREVLPGCKFGPAHASSDCVAATYKGMTVAILFKDGAASVIGTVPWHLSFESRHYKDKEAFAKGMREIHGGAPSYNCDI